MRPNGRVLACVASVALAIGCSTGGSVPGAPDGSATQPGGPFTPGGRVPAGAVHIQADPPGFKTHPVATSDASIVVGPGRELTVNAARLAEARGADDLRLT